MVGSDSWLQDLDSRGFVFSPIALPEYLLGEIEQALASQPRSNGRRRGGYRNLLDEPAFSRLVATASLRRLADTALGPDTSCIRAILFEKNPIANLEGSVAPGSVDRRPGSARWY